MPLYGKLSDQYGRKPMTYVAVLIFLAGSILSGFAQSMTQLILFRAIQGIGEVDAVHHRFDDPS